MAFVVCCAAVFVWLTSLPWEIKKIRMRPKGAPLEKYFLDKGRFVTRLNALASETLPNIYVEFGRDDHRAYNRRMMASFAGWTSQAISPAHRLRTSQPINLVVVATSGPSSRKVLEEFCAEHEGRSFNFTQFPACRTTLQPNEAG